MSRIDPGLLQPNIPKMDPWPTLVQRQQEDLQRANIESQIAERKANETIRGIAAQEKLAQAQKMQQDWEEKRRTYNAQETVRSYIQNAQSQGRQMPSIDELIGIGGNYAMPFLKEMVDRTKDDLANRAEQTKKYLSLHDMMIDAFSLEPDVSRHPDIEKTVYQRAMQAGLVTPEEVNQFLQKPPDQLTELEAQRKTLLRNNEDLKAKTAQNLEDQKVLETAAKASETQAKTAREQEELRRIQQNLPPVPSAPPNAPQPSAGYTPEAFEQQKELARIRAAAAAANKTPTEVPELGDIIETTNSGRRYISVENLSTKQKESVTTQASKQGIPVVAKDVAEMLRDLDTARANQRFMLNAIESKLPRDAAGRIIIGPANKLKTISQLDPDLAATGTFRNAAIQSMRALAGSRGLRINRAEIEMAQQNDIPQATDTIEVARKKLNNIMALLDNTEKAHLERDRSQDGTAKRAGTVIDPAGGEHYVTDVDAAIKLHPGTKEKK